MEREGRESVRQRGRMEREGRERGRQRGRMEREGREREGDRGGRWRERETEGRMELLLSGLQSVCVVVVGG